MNNTVLTYGTFDLFHVGHLRLLERLREQGTKLIVGVSTDEFNAVKGKTTIIPFSERIEIIRALACVDMAIPEESWDQKEHDIEYYAVNTFAMGSDWKGKFNELQSKCNLVYLPRTEGISSTKLKQALRSVDKAHVEDLKSALDLIASVVQSID